MKSPKDFQQPLTAAELAQVAELERAAEEWFKTHDEAHYNTMTDANRQFPPAVWEEFARRASEAGWHVETPGAMVILRKK